MGIETIVNVAIVIKVIYRKRNETSASYVILQKANSIKNA
jgi:hypothetical protein